MKFDDIARTVGNPAHSTQPSPSDVHPARLAEPERPSRVSGVQSGCGEKGVAHGRVFAGNVQPKESAASDLPSDF